MVRNIGFLEFLRIGVQISSPRPMISLSHTIPYSLLFSTIPPFFLSEADVPFHGDFLG
jgi:hypothetical protein